MHYIKMKNENDNNSDSIYNLQWNINGSVSNIASLSLYPYRLAQNRRG
jgi:phosphoribosylformylglycinamidine (FGAM) synthase-like amidotransferase family enzyme